MKSFEIVFDFANYNLLWIFVNKEDLKIWFEFCWDTCVVDYQLDY